MYNVSSSLVLASEYSYFVLFVDPERNVIVAVDMSSYKKVLLSRKNVKTLVIHALSAVTSSYDRIYKLVKCNIRI